MKKIDARDILNSLEVQTHDLVKISKGFTAANVLQKQRELEKKITQLHANPQTRAAAGPQLEILRSRGEPIEGQSVVLAMIHIYGQNFIQRFHELHPTVRLPDFPSLLQSKEVQEALEETVPPLFQEEAVRKLQQMLHLALQELFRGTRVGARWYRNSDPDIQPEADVWQRKLRAVVLWLSKQIGVKSR